jgi:hypothetical protein
MSTSTLPAPCRWFLRCDRPAASTLPHPVLGAVPVCAVCLAKVARLSRKEG